jgi:hypothetical protein
MSRTGATFHSVEMAIATFLTSSLLLGQDASWMKLGLIDRGTTYSVILRNGTCVQGTIRSVNPDLLTLATPAKNGATNIVAPRILKVARLDVLQVKDGLGAFDVVFSGRSSWRDVQSIPHRTREYPSITLKSGKLVRGELVGSTDFQLSVKQSSAAMNIAKTDIAFVDYIRLKPPPYDRIREFPAEVLDPRVWPYMFNIGVHMSVPVFNSTLPEDDSILQCAIRQ